MKKTTGLLLSTLYLMLSLSVISCNKDDADIKVIGVFSVSSTDQVSFSQGNLQYQPSTNAWRFAEQQYDVIGESNSNISATYDGWIDLFGWGTGDNPTFTSEDNDDYKKFVDWGSNAIGNGGNSTNEWRTLSSSEWDYLFNIRTNSTNLGTKNARYVKAIVNDVKGVILFPDSYSHPKDVSKPSEGINDYNVVWVKPENNNRYTLAKKYTLANWLKMESAGAVFLPVSGYRKGTNVNGMGENGCYWSSTSCGNGYSSFVNFVNDNLNATSNYGRSYGLSVRLVRDKK